MEFISKLIAAKYGVSITSKPDDAAHYGKTTVEVYGNNINYTRHFTGDDHAGEAMEWLQKVSEELGTN